VRNEVDGDIYATVLVRRLIISGEPAKSRVFSRDNLGQTALYMYDPDGGGSMRKGN
jgi:hypothetical protein